MLWSHQPIQFGLFLPLSHKTLGFIDWTRGTENVARLLWSWNRANSRLGSNPSCALPFVILTFVRWMQNLPYPRNINFEKRRRRSTEKVRQGMWTTRLPFSRLRCRYLVRISSNLTLISLKSLWPVRHFSWEIRPDNAFLAFGGSGGRAQQMRKWRERGEGQRRKPWHKEAEFDWFGR